MWFWLFVASSCLNLLAIFYIRWLIRTIAIINEDVENITNLVSDFGTHTKSVHDLRMFYGDENLEALMIHASELSEKLSSLDLVLNKEKDLDAEQLEVEEAPKKEN